MWFDDDSCSVGSGGLRMNRFPYVPGFMRPKPLTDHYSQQQAQKRILDRVVRLQCDSQGNAKA